jgi:hypothetical protein
MGLNLFKDVDILDVHHYEQRVTILVGGDPKKVRLYSAYYEYFVTPEALPSDFLVPEGRGKFAYRFQIYDRESSVVLHEEVGYEDTYRDARGMAQLSIQPLMEEYKLEGAV